MKNVKTKFLFTDLKFYLLDFYGMASTTRPEKVTVKGF